MNANGGMYLPPHIVQGRFTHFGFHSIDFQEDGPDDRNNLHGTVVVIYQTILKSDVTKDFKLVSDEENIDIPDKIYLVLECSLPKDIKLQNETMNTYIPSSHKTLCLTNSIMQDLVWIIGVMTNLIQNNKSNKLLLTWAAHNSYICKGKKK